MIFHPWRMRKDKKEDLKHIAQGLDQWAPGDFGLWKTLIKLENWRDYVYWAPHYHIIGVTRWLEEGDYDEDLVFKRIGDLNEINDVIKCSMYLLSHIGLKLEINTKNVLWYGTLANNKWSIAKAPKEIRDYVLALLYENLKNFSKGEGEGFMDCKRCGARILAMSFAPKFYDNFDKETCQLLKYCYQWSSGSIPPPSPYECVLIQRKVRSMCNEKKLQ